VPGHAGEKERCVKSGEFVGRHPKAIIVSFPPKPSVSLLLAESLRAVGLVLSSILEDGVVEGGVGAGCSGLNNGPGLRCLCCDG
jgi:hypothetical protein